MSVHLIAILGCVLLFTVVVLLSSSLKKVASTEFGVQYDVFSKRLADTPKRGGLHLGPPFFRFIKVPSTFITINIPDATCVSKDGLRIVFAVTFQYQIPEDWVVPAVKKYRNYEKWEKVVHAAGNSAVQHTCSEFNISNFQNQRGVIQNRMEENLHLKLEGKDGDGHSGVYTRAVSLQLRELTLPVDYNTAVIERQEAAELVALAKNQRSQETTKANTNLLSAREEANKITDKAVNDASIVLAKAKLKAEEILFSFEKDAKIIRSVKDALSLTNEGVLAYLANNLMGEAKNLKVSVGEPASFSWSDEL